MAIISGSKTTIATVLISFIVVVAESKSFSGNANRIVTTAKMSKRPSYEQYIASRESICKAESINNFESDVKLNPKEERANAVIMAAKNAELDDGLKHPQNFSPSRHFFEAIDKINRSKLFKIIRKMPKGGILHAHDTALCSTDYLVSLTYREHLWQCNDGNNKIVSFKFSTNVPEHVDGCSWLRVADERERVGRVEYDAYIRSNFTLVTNDPHVKFNDINAVWNEFMGLFIRFEPLVTYAPVFKDYYKQALKEMLQDGVQYLELRVLLPPVRFSQFSISGGPLTSSISYCYPVNPEFKLTVRSLLHGQTLKRL